MSYKMFQHLTSVPELLHMSIIEPMKDESYGRHRYIFDYEDEYSIIEKCDTLFIWEAICHNLRHVKREEIKNIIHTRSQHGREFTNSNTHFSAQLKELFTSLILPYLPN